MYVLRVACTNNDFREWKTNDLIYFDFVRQATAKYRYVQVERSRGFARVSAAIGRPSPSLRDNGENPVRASLTKQTWCIITLHADLPLRV